MNLELQTVIGENGEFKGSLIEAKKLGLSNPTLEKKVNTHNRRASRGMEFLQFATPSKPNSHYLVPGIFSLKRGFPMGIPTVERFKNG